MWESLTYWYNGRYEITVGVGIFDSKEKALAFGSARMSLVCRGERLVIISAESGQELDEAFDENISVGILKADCEQSMSFDDNDYQPFNLKIIEFSSNPYFSSLVAGSVAVESIGSWNQFCFNAREISCIEVVLK